MTSVSWEFYKVKVRWLESALQTGRDIARDNFKPQDVVSMPQQRIDSKQHRIALTNVIAPLEQTGA
jgi:hypothetical protein